MATRKSSGNKSVQTGKKSQNARRSNRSTQAALAFWLIFIVVLIGLFYFQRDTIKENYNILARRLKLPLIVSPDTAATETREPTAPEVIIDKKPARTPQSSSPSSGTPSAGGTQAINQPAAQEKPEQTQSAPLNKPDTSQPAAQPAPASRTGTDTRPQNQPIEQATPTAPPVRPAETRERSIYFTQINNDSDILRVKVTRNIAVSDSPLIDSLNSLLAGPSAEETRRGLLNLIPPQTKIRSATVRDSTAYISFSEEFQYNSYGVEGYAAQLRQVVWTATEFSNVNDVQILIEGKRIDYLGEGIWIGSPVSRGSL